MNAPHEVCHRCRGRAGTLQPSDGDAAMLFAAAAHVLSDEVVLCIGCTRTLEAMALRAAGENLRRPEARPASPAFVQALARQLEGEGLEVVRRDGPTPRPPPMSQACGLYQDHARCPGENTLGTSRCMCACHDAEGRS